MNLTIKEVQILTGKKQHSKQCAELDYMSIPYTPRLNGSPAVSKSAVEKILGGSTSAQQKIYTPDAEGLREMCNV